MKDNADFHSAKVLLDRTKKKKASGVIKEQYVTVGIKKNGTVIDRLRLRRITYKATDGNVYVFITNQMTLNAEEIAIKKSFANTITVIPLYITSYINLMEFIKDTYKAWRKTYGNIINFSP